MTTTTKRFNMALSALIGAFFTNTLAKGLCTACAVGNIVAKANGVRIKEILENGAIAGTGQAGMYARGMEMGLRVPLDNASWRHLFFTGTSEDSPVSEQRKFITPEQQLEGIEKGAKTRDEYNSGLVAIAATGYSAEELAKVESAFETASHIKFQDYANHTSDEIKEDQYNGLCAVVDVLCELDGNSEDAAEYRKAFEYSTHPDFHADNEEFIEELMAIA